MRAARTPALAARVAEGFRLPHEAAATGVEIYALVIADDDDAPDEATTTLVARYLEAVREAGLEDVCRTLAEYATTLAASPALLDEERSKILSLCDEVEALGALGLPFDASDRTAFVDTMTGLLAADRGRYAHLARRRLDPARRHLWHVRLLLG